MKVWVKAKFHIRESPPGLQDVEVFDGFEVRDYPFEGATVRVVVGGSPMTLFLVIVEMSQYSYVDSVWNDHQAALNHRQYLQEKLVREVRIRPMKLNSSPEREL